MNLTFSCQVWWPWWEFEVTLTASLESWSCWKLCLLDKFLTCLFKQCVTWGWTWCYILPTLRKNFFFLFFSTLTEMSFWGGGWDLWKTQNDHDGYFQMLCQFLVTSSVSNSRWVSVRKKWWKSHLPILNASPRSVSRCSELLPFGTCHASYKRQLQRTGPPNCSSCGCCQN